MVCMVWTLLLLPSCVWDYVLVPKTRERVALKVFHPRCGVCKFLGAFLSTFVLLGCTDISEEKSQPSTPQSGNAQHNTTQHNTLTCSF